ncbi:MAG TPA: aspartate/glutamate racemase family protein [Xanthobacteraceae bacterium]|nr:aspartate/glutamate racemase family protein [Xanthobacteraceae bacterium]
MEGELTATKTFRIWAQGATDQVAHHNYLAKLLPHMKACVDPGFALEFKTMTPSVTTVHALSEFRFSREVIRGALQAEREHYDVFFMNHFQDVGLYDARASVNIPVLGLGEATLLHACTMGRKLGLLAINPAFIPTHSEQIHRYGLQQRIAGIRAVNASIADYMVAFAAPAKKAELWALFEHEARRLIDDGADIIVPTGGIPMMLFGDDPSANVDGAPIVNGITVVIKAAEMAVKLKRLGFPTISRHPQSGFALPSAQSLEEFLSHG